MNSLETQLGYYVGEFIVTHTLPTLNIDLIKTRKVIHVSIPEADEYHRRDAAWQKTFNGHTSEPNKEWEAMRTYRNELAKKYLPETLECFIPRIDFVENFKYTDFKKGLSFSLWDCDCSWYSCDEDKIEMVEKETPYHTLIKLKLEV